MFKAGRFRTLASHFFEYVYRWHVCDGGDHHEPAREIDVRRTLHGAPVRGAATASAAGLRRRAKKNLPPRRARSEKERERARQKQRQRQRQSERERKSLKKKEGCSKKRGMLGFVAQVGKVSQHPGELARSGPDSKREFEVLGFTLNPNRAPDVNYTRVAADNRASRVVVYTRTNRARLGVLLSSSSLSLSRREGGYVRRSRRPSLACAASC